MFENKKKYIHEQNLQTIDGPTQAERGHITGLLTDRKLLGRAFHRALGR